MHHYTPGHSTVVQSNIPIKLDSESGLQVVLVLHIHDSSMRVLKQVVLTHRNLQYPRKIILRRRGTDIQPIKGVGRRSSTTHTIQPMKGVGRRSSTTHTIQPTKGVGRRSSTTRTIQPTKGVGRRSSTTRTIQPTKGVGRRSSTTRTIQPTKGVGRRSSTQ